MEYEVGLTTVASHRPSGTRWEIYGSHDDDPAQPWTGVYWLLS